MSSYLLSDPTYERFKKASDIVLGAPERQANLYEPVNRPPPTTHRAVLVTGAPTNGRWPMKLQYRDEPAADPNKWKDFEPAITGWAIPFATGDTLENGARYAGMLVSLDPSDGQAVFAVTTGGGADPGAVVQVTSERVSTVYYRSYKGTQFNEPTRSFVSKEEILVLDAADIGFPP